MNQKSCFPFFLVNSFEDLCKYVLFHYVQIGGVAQSESNYQNSSRYDQQDQNALGRQSGRSEQLAIDFSEEPNGILVEPIKIKFLMKSSESNGSPSIRANNNIINDLNIEIPQVS